MFHVKRAHPLKGRARFAYQQEAAAPHNGRSTGSF